MQSKVVSDFLQIYNRKEEELLSPAQLESKGVFSGEKEFIEFAEKDYNTDKHWSFEIKKEECALLVIDMQEDFVNPSHPMCVPEAYRMVPRMKNVIEECRDQNVPVIFTAHNIAEDCSAGFYQYWEPIKNGAIKEGTPGADIYKGIYPLPNERVIRTKHAYCSFAGTDLDYVLRNLGVKTLIISGTLTNFCCESTARTGYFLNYNIVFGEDINATDSALAHEATLRTMRRGFARVLPAEQITKTLKEGDNLYHDAIAGKETASLR
ncbi:cysteine hydrolase [Peribacillus cavernae]|uniref:Cysteine hydrolase n=1 Tax=Peribacillus cavernae TaxID=1674310 RepID=A0A3S0UAL3_9BACI|nr:isochorismatase family cysteine hydrolase [Peribacillus cavernae]MDQ0219567.1 nicotinamidase-related amidase [Peribacillus cavernae]RUQ27026.1 cysteine hydrolase [Peribacillus cavernae]